MTWDAFHRRGEVLRAVVDHANARRDGDLPMELSGVAETFGDELALVAALQLRWHTRLTGHIERALSEQPADLEAAVVRAWRAAASELVGVRAILDRQAVTATPHGSPEVAHALERAAAKDHAMLAAMAGLASVSDERAARLGRQLEERARAGFDPDAGAGARHRAEAPTARTAGPGRRFPLLGRIRRAVLAA